MVLCSSFAIIYGCRAQRFQGGVASLGSFVLVSRVRRMNMKQILPLLLATGLAATMAGCQSATETEDAPAQSGVDSANFTLVTLKVPNMV